MTGILLNYLICIRSKMDGTDDQLFYCKYIAKNSDYLCLLYYCFI